MSVETLILTLLREFLLRARNADGGWGYHPGKRAGWNPRAGRASLSEARWSPQFWSSGPVPTDSARETRWSAPTTRFMGRR